MVLTTFLIKEATMITGEGCKWCGHPDSDHSNGLCHWRQHGAVLACDCIMFVSPTAEAVSALPQDEQEVLACANYLGIDPERISRVETTADGDDHFTGLKVIIHISTGRQVGAWVRSNIPKERIRWVTEYLTKRIPAKAS